MAARKKAWTPDKVRERIQASMITNRLIDHTLGNVEMTSSQVTAGLGLLKKIVPDLSSTELSGSIQQQVISDKPMSSDEWEKEYSLESTAGATKSTH